MNFSLKPQPSLQLAFHVGPVSEGYHFILIIPKAMCEHTDRGTFKHHAAFKAHTQSYWEIQVLLL